MQECIL